MTKYSTRNEAALAVCNHLGWDECGAIEAFKRGGKTYARGTLLKPDEWLSLIRHHRETMSDGTELRITTVPARYRDALDWADRNNV